MATYNVSNASQLMSAVNSARGGDVIRCAGGSYGSINITKKFSGNVTITSASDSNKAKFTTVTVKGAANVTFDSLKFEGSGATGYGLKVSQSSNVKVLDSTFAKYTNGANFSRVSGLTVDNNDFTSMKYDAMRFAGVSNTNITKNKYVESGSVPGNTHKDFVQFWTNSSNGEGPSKNVRISGNEFYSKDGLTHGIFIMNPASSMGKHQNIVIENNYLKSSHVHGITVAGANLLEIRNNVLIRDGKQYPLINVTPDSTNVKIINNTAPSVPNIGNSTWIVSNNKETAGSVLHWTGGKTGIKVENTGSGSGATSGGNTDTGSGSSGGTASGNGDADVFRFLGTAADKDSRLDTVRDLDFGDGDTLVFNLYDNGTFRDFSGGNIVWNNAAGTYVVVDSLADLRELDQASPAIRVAADRASDVVMVQIAQGAHTHKLALHGLADEYLAL